MTKERKNLSYPRIQTMEASSNHLAHKLTEGTRSLKLLNHADFIVNIALFGMLLIHEPPFSELLLSLTNISCLSCTVVTWTNSISKD